MSVESRLQRLGLAHLEGRPDELGRALEDMAAQIKQRQATVGQQAADVIRLAEIDLLQRMMREEREENMIAMKAPLFKLGQITATPGCLDALAKNGQSVWEFVSLHASGNWGVVGVSPAPWNGSRIAG